MATLTISLSGSSVVNGSKQWSISDNDVQRIVTYFQNRALVDTGASITPAQALVQWATGFINTTNQVVQSAEIEKQRSDVTAPPLTFT